ASLRPLAEAVGSSTGVLRFLFGSKDGLVSAVLERARVDELDLLATIPPGADLADVARAIWSWLAVLGRAQPAAERNTAAGRAKRTAVLAVLRGAMLDLIATGDRARTTRAI